MSPPDAEQHGDCSDATRPRVETSPPRTNLTIDIDCVARANFAMHQNRVRLVTTLSVTNTGDEAVTDLRLRLRLANGEAEPLALDISLIEPGETYNIEPDGPRLDGSRLADRTERERTELIVEAALPNADGEAEPGWHRLGGADLDLLPFDHWGGLAPCPELLAAFVTPNHPALTPVLHGARELLRAAGERDAIDGYQSGSPTRSARLGEVCFASLLRQDIGYINPPSSFERAGQRVRLADQVLRERLGTCLDLSLLLVGLWEQAGLNPLVLLFEDHALPAFWTRDEHLAQPSTDEPARLRTRVGLGELVVVESTALTDRDGTFEAAVASAARRLDRADTVCAVDLRTARRLGVRPLPLRVEPGASTIAPDAVLPHQGSGQASLPAVELAERAAGLDAASAGDAGPGDRVDRWKRRLLDLSLRNRLLNFRETKRVVGFAAHDLAVLEDMLAAGDTFDLVSKADRPAQEREGDADADREFLAAELRDGRLFSTLTEAETSRRLLEIYRASRSSIEETGANILYLALGMLRWFETAGAETPRRAPLILLPVRLVRRAAGGGYRYRVELTNEPLRPNVTLIEKLRVDYGMDVRTLDDLPEDEKGLDVPMILRRFREAVRDASGWEVEESLHLGLLSFSKFLMWHDLQQMGPAMREQRLLGTLLGVGEPDAEGPRPTEALTEAVDLDESLPPGELLCTRDADSSQLMAVRAAREGRTFVLEGPPGTGKSQTIANIIADAIGNGKRVLFVAEKMAALSVVRRRLGRDGLGPFCLELHSAKASKKEVLRQLGEAIDADRVAEPRRWGEMCGELDETRGRLNAYVRELHEPRESGESIYGLIGRLSALGEGATVDLGLDDPGAVTESTLGGWRGHVRAMTQAAGPIDPAAGHRLRAIGRSAWSFGLPDQARQAIGAAGRALTALRRATEVLLDEAWSAHSDKRSGEELSRALSASEVRALREVVVAVCASPRPPRELLVAAGSPDSVAVLEAWITRGRDVSARHARLMERYRPELLDADLLGILDRARQARDKPGIVRWFFAGRARKEVRPYALSAVPQVGGVIGDLEESLAVLAERKELARRDTEAVSGFGDRWRGVSSDWEALAADLAWVVGFRAAAAPLGGTEVGRDIVDMMARLGCAGMSGDANAWQAAASVFTDAFARWDTEWAALDGLLSVCTRSAWDGPDTGGWFDRAEEALRGWGEALPGLNDWCAWRAVRDAACADGLTALVEAYERGDVRLSALPEVFERSFGEPWLIAAADSSDAVRGFNARSHSSAIARFCELDREVIRLTRNVVGSRLVERLPGTSASPAPSSEVGILRRELEKRARHMPTRRLIEALPNLLPRLKPCFLMSPLSVAQYLDPAQPPFDLVVFDEASQIPVWDAIGSMARGTDVIVVGDSKQLPPTNFFNTMGAEQDDDDDSFVAVDDDLESVLQECTASGVPSLRLKWHYRSRHESLITFSNHHYYDDELHTFPSPVSHSRELGVSFRLVEDGVYDRGGSRTNRAEAEAVVGEVVRRLAEPGANGSIGVVTFNTQQQGLIEDLFDDARREHPEIEPFFSAVEEPVFVKNLENVQGDERDTIIFSVGFGPDGEGRMSMNFGPLNISGGERRLNVAVTRARYRLLVFCSMQPELIDLSRTRATGVHHFKRFLMYAQRGPSAMAEAAAAHAGASVPSEFETVVRAALESRGWHVTPRVGLAGYRVDLAIDDPEREGEYLVGIECDGPMYRHALTARDRDRTRVSVLRGLGWRLVRVWSAAWRHDREGCIELIEDAVEQARAERETAAPQQQAVADSVPDGTGLPGTRTLHDPVDQQQDAQGDLRTAGPPVEVYRAAARPRGVTSRSDVFQESTDGLAVQALAALVEQEAPVVPELAIRRLAEWFGVSRVTDRFRARFEEILALAVVEGRVTGSGDSLWPVGVSPDEAVRVRTAGDDESSQRDVEWIPLIERAAAVRRVLDAQIGLPRDDLEREAARMLGIARATAKTRDAMAEAIDEVLAVGAAHEADGRVVVSG